jgi:hypothetical protein
VINLLEAIIMAPINGVIGGASAITKSLRNSVDPAAQHQPLDLALDLALSVPTAPHSAPATSPQLSAQVTAPPQAPLDLQPAPTPGRWADLPLPAVQPAPPPAPAIPVSQPVVPATPSPVVPATPPPKLPAAPLPPPRPEFEFRKSPERNTSMDRDLNDDMNKLVRYSIVCVDREHETILQGMQEEVVNERMDEGGFTAWKIMEFVQAMGHDEVDVPLAWRGSGKRPEGVVVHEGKDGRLKLRSIGRDTRMFLRVPFQVVDRYPRERFKYEEKQIEVLEQIRGKMGHGHGLLSDLDVPAGQKKVIEIEGK